MNKKNNSIIKMDVKFSRFPKFIFLVMNMILIIQCLVKQFTIIFQDNWLHNQQSRQDLLFVYLFMCWTKNVFVYSFSHLITLFSTSCSKSSHKNSSLNHLLVICLDVFFHMQNINKTNTY